MTISVTSTAFEAGKPIPKKYTGEGEDLSPPLAWSNVPKGTKELALICDDPDAPMGTWVHWVLYKIPADATSLPEGLPREKTLKTPAGAVQGVNSFSRTTWAIAGRCRRRATARIITTSRSTPSISRYPRRRALTRRRSLAEIHDHVLAQGELVGTYQR